jgi:hypothetical protein
MFAKEISMELAQSVVSALFRNAPRRSSSLSLFGFR